MIKLFQLDRLWSEIRQDALEGIDFAAGEGWAQRGPAVEYLEKWLCELSDRRYAITVASCTDAIRCCVEYLAKDRVDGIADLLVAVPNYSFIATSNAVKAAGGNRVFIDVDEDYHIKHNLIPDTCDAVVAVDLFGLPQNYTALEKLNMPVIMDCAQSIETSYKGRSSLNVGWAACVSFAPTKTIPAFGSGGAIVTDDVAFAQWARQWRTHGKQSNKHYSVTRGANSMISSLEAVTVLCSVKHHWAWRDLRQSIAEEYTSSIEDSSLIIAPNTRGIHTWHKYVIRCQDAKTRVEFEKHMADRQIETQQVYAPLPWHEEVWLGNMDNNEALTNSNSFWLSERSVSIPCQHTLTDSEVAKIAEALKDFR